MAEYSLRGCYAPDLAFRTLTASIGSTTMGDCTEHSEGVLSMSTTKKVCVRRFGLNPLEGYVYPKAYLSRHGIEVLARSAETVLVPYQEVRAVYFVRDFGEDPERYQRREFATRPKLGGLWVRMCFRDGEALEGVMPNDLTNVGEYGVTLTPPDSKGNTQRVFVPRDALKAFQVMGVIGRPKPLDDGRKKGLTVDQMGLFGSSQASR